MHVNDVYVGNGVGTDCDGNARVYWMMAMKCWCQCLTIRYGQQQSTFRGTAVHYKCDEENYWYPDVLRIWKQRSRQIRVELW